MYFAVSSTLKHRTLTTIAVALWDRLSISPCHLISDHNSLKFTRSVCKWIFKHRCEIKAAVQQLNIPDTLKAELNFYVVTVMVEVLTWTFFHENHFHINDCAQTTFSWTAHATIDWSKTSKELICDENQDVVNRYKLAAIYCQEQHMLALAEQLDEIEIDRLELVESSFLEIYWGLYIVGRQNLLPGWGTDLLGTGHSYGFLISVPFSIENAVRFFFQKVATEDKERLVEKAISLLCMRERNINGFFSRTETDIFCFLLNAVKEDQQMEIIRKSPRVVLKYFLVWPWVEYFTELYRQVKHLLSEDDFCELLIMINFRVMASLTGYAYVQVLRDVWCQSCISYRKFVIEKHDITGVVLGSLFRLQEWGIFSLILQDATAEQKEKLLSCKELYESYKTCVAHGGWDILKSFATECLSSREEVVTFRETVRRYYTWCHSRNKFPDRICEWDNLFRVLDCVINNNKRSAEDGVSKPKRLCSSSS